MFRQRTHSSRAGFTLIEMMIVLVIIAIVAAIAVPNLLRSRIQSNEATTIQNLRAIISAQTAYHAANGEFADSLEALANDEPPFLDHDFLQEPLSGYLYTFGEEEDRSNYLLNADPAHPGTSGIRRFFADGSGVIRFSLDGPAGPDSPVIR